MGKRQPATPPGIDQLPSGAFRARAYGPDGKRRTLGTYETVEAAAAARREAQQVRASLTGRTPGSDAAWLRRTRRRLAYVHPDDRPLLDLFLDALQRMTASR